MWGGLGLGICMTWASPHCLEVGFLNCDMELMAPAPLATIGVKGEDEERWLRSCGSAGPIVLNLDHGAAPILGRTEVPGAKVGVTRLTWNSS